MKEPIEKLSGSGKTDDFGADVRRNEEAYPNRVDDEKRLTAEQSSACCPKSAVLTKPRSCAIGSNIRLVIAYEGTRYFGWQKTAMGPSIEAELETRLTQILQHPVKLQAASRTDRGVHARHQVVNFFTDKPIGRLKKSLNMMLPEDISVYIVDEMPDHFHPTLDCKGKVYEYALCLGQVQLPFHRFFSWHFPYPLDLQKMKRAAAYLIGRHDFSALTNEKQEDNIREIYSILLTPLENRLTIQVSGNNFLYKMVRNIVGTLVYVGCGKLKAEEIPSILEGKDRTRAGMTAPAHGLCLKQVVYDFS